jgi:hypothetical protein
MGRVPIYQMQSPEFKPQYCKVQKPKQNKSLCAPLFPHPPIVSIALCKIPEVLVDSMVGRVWWRNIGVTCIEVTSLSEAGGERKVSQCVLWDGC